MNEGWKCPGCGSCYAPWVPKCSTCTDTVDNRGFHWVPTPLVIEQCDHVWSEPGNSTLGVTCGKCGQLMGQEGGIKTFTTCEANTRSE